MTENDEKKIWDYKDWYAKNADELSEKRKSKYQDDPSYREKVLAQNRQYREKKAAIAAADRMARRNARASGLPIEETSQRPRKNSQPVVMQVELNGEMVARPLVHVGEFARMIDRSVATIHTWEKSGLIPKTPFVIGNRKQERMYMPEMAEAINAAIDARGSKVFAGDAGFYQEVVRGWAQVGVVVRG